MAVTSKDVLLDSDDLFDNAVKVCVRYNLASVSLLQRKLAIGYARAARLIDQMEKAGIVKSARGGKTRKVIISSYKGVKQPYDDRLRSKLKGLLLRLAEDIEDIAFRV